MWPRDPDTLPELESLDFTIPQRSRLYRLMPMGWETSQVEGQLSYLVRLARANSVNPRRLVGSVFASGNPAIRKLKYAGSFVRHAGTINGLGKYAELFLSEPENILPSMRDSLRPVPEKLFGRGERPLLGVRARRKLATELNLIIDTPEDVRSLPEVAKSLGLTRSCLKYWFPEEYASIQDKCEAASKRGMATRAESERDAVVSAVRLVRERGEYPARRKDNEELLKQKMLLIRPDLLRVYRQAVTEIQE